MRVNPIMCWFKLHQSSL